MMNVIKVGGSIINPDGKYNQKVIKELIALCSHGEFIFVVGGGDLNQKILRNTEGLLQEALPASLLEISKDYLGIAITKINANYVLEEFRKKYGEEVYPKILYTPEKVKSNARIFFMGGMKPGHSTDQDMMMLAEIYAASTIIKLSNFVVVKKVNPLELSKLDQQERKKKLTEAEEISSMTWEELRNLVGTEWKARLNTPFDPRAVETGCRLKPRLMIGEYSELSKMLAGKEFRGTVVEG
jgi:uridylate kinase